MEKKKKQKELIANLAEEFKEIARLSKVPLGDFPRTEIYEKVLPEKDFTKFPPLSDKMYQMMEEILMKDLPKYMQMASPNSTEGKAGGDEYNPFDETSDDKWDIPHDFQEQALRQWGTLSPSNEPLTGLQLKNPLLETKAPQDSLKKIWNLADIGKTGKLDRDEFILAMWLANQAREGIPTPATLPDGLIPPSKKKGILFSQ